MGGGALLEETAASLLGAAYLTPQLEGALQVGDLDGFVAHLTLQRRRIPLHILNQLEEILHPHLEADYAELLAEIARDPGKCWSMLHFLAMLHPSPVCSRASRLARCLPGLQ